MAVTTRKRKGNGDGHPEGSNKRFQADSSSRPALKLEFEDDDDDDDDYIKENAESDECSEYEAQSTGMLDAFYDPEVVSMSIPTISDQIVETPSILSECEAQSVETPNTPFSPARKRFPSELKTIKCTYEGCTKTFNRPARLTAHLRSHTNERPFVCTYEGCDKAYLDSKHLRAHVSSCHTNERTFQCQWQGCGKSFLTSTRLKRHRAVHEGKNRFTCSGYPPCNQTFRKHQTLQRHIRSDHLELAPYPCTFVDPVTNIPCNAGFDGAGGLRKHQDRVHALPRFFCPECLEPNMISSDGEPMHLGFQTETMLQAHIRKEHVNCPFCDRKLSSKRELELHVESQHSGKPLEERKNVPCTHDGCNKMFTKPYNRDQHVLIAHEGQRYICGAFDVSDTTDIAHWDGSDACAAELRSKANLEDHIRTAHLGLQSLLNSKRKKLEPKVEKPSLLEELTGVANDNDARRTIPCFMPTCEHKFMRDYDLQNHLRSAHRLPSPVIEEIVAAGVEAPGEVYRQQDQDSDWALEMPQEQFWVGDNARISPDQWAEDNIEMR